MGKMVSADMKNTRVAKAPVPPTPIPGPPIKASADMSGTRMTKKSEMRRVNDPAHKFGKMGLNVGTRVTSREVGKGGKVGN
jgi:hypothetical protein